MNETQKIVKSFVGVSDCISEVMEVNVNTAPIAGAGAWRDFSATGVTARVTGQCLATTVNEAAMSVGSTLEIEVGKYALMGVVTSSRTTTDATGRAMREYEVVSTRRKYILPHQDKIVLLYVPKWQTPSTSLHDWIADEDLTITGTWDSEGALVCGNGMRKRQLTHTITIPTCTVLVDRDMNVTPNKSNFGSCGLILAHAEPVNTSSTMSILYESWYDNVRFLRIANQNITNTTFSASGWSHIRVANYKADYDNRTYNVQNMQSIKWVAINRTTVPLWSKIRCIAVWSVRLTDEELEQAKTYFDNTPDAFDFTR